jgi:hypothetical protein
MNRKRFSFALCALVATMPLLAHAADPAPPRVEFENEQIRVVRISLPPHQSRPIESHPRRLVVFLTPGNLKLQFPDGTSKTSTHVKRDFYWSEPVSYGVENLSDSAVEEIDIEWKQDRGPGVQTALPVYTDPRPAGTESDPVPAAREPHHRPAFRNQYGEVLDVIINPGETFLYHRHALDHIAIEFEDADLNRQTAGKDWAPGPARFGHADFGAGYKVPYVHRVTNVGSNTLHVLDMEIFP